MTRIRTTFLIQSVVLALFVTLGIPLFQKMAMNSSVWKANKQFCELAFYLATALSTCLVVGVGTLINRSSLEVYRLGFS